MISRGINACVSEGSRNIRRKDGISEGKSHQELLAVNRVPYRKAYKKAHARTKMLGHEPAALILFP